MKTLEILKKCILLLNLLKHSRNYMPPILVQLSATQILVIAKLNKRKNFTLIGFILDIILPSKELTVQI